jgi:hypothetical protein
MKEECEECFLVTDINLLEEELDKKEEQLEYYRSILMEIAMLPDSVFHTHYTLKEKIERMKMIAEKAQKGKW